jgi:DNA-binding CsgD family transcriptional regulator
MTHFLTEDQYLAHYGVLRKSGRYPWGSGETQEIRNQMFLDTVAKFKADGMGDTDIARGLGMTTSELRAAKSIAKNEQKAAQISQAQRFKEHGYSTSEIGRRMNLNESTVRSLLAPGQADKVKILDTTADMLKGQVDEKGYIDIGSGVEQHVGVSRTRLDTAVAKLKEKGYEVHTVQVDQLGTNNKTAIKVLAPPGTTYRDIASNKDQIRGITEKSDDGGRSFLGLQPPQNVDSKRVKVRYAEEGGTDADGVIYLRPGVKDLDLGGSRYAQVRIAVDGTHYLKGMAMYKDDLPDGVDLMFNTNKSDKGDPLKAMKPMKTKSKDDPTIDLDNPFGSAIKPGGQRGALNIVNEEGDWDKWSKNLSSQMLSKQSPELARQQLAVSLENKKADLADINQLTNPLVRRKLLEAYAEGADASAVHLKAAALPRSASHVILPINSMKETEIYAPNYENGERVVLIRYPHGGKFEIPQLVVNNNHPEAKKALGPGTNGQKSGARDAVGINSKVAERLSGADFDGDTVLVIPNNKGQVHTSPALTALKGFDPQSAYPAYEGMPKMSARTKGQQMGKISNLITDMTIKGATNEELARAVKHSMVVIDAEKHNLNYKQSALDNNIPSLIKKYQPRETGPDGGASTLISRATARQDVLARKPTPLVDKATGKKIYVETGENWTDADGKVRYAMQKSQQLKETDNAYDLSSGTKMEAIYAEHSNAMKSLANEARKSAVNTKTTPYSESARKAYAPEVASLNAKLNTALKNRPLERQAQLLANTQVRLRMDANPDMDAAEVKKIKGQALQEARRRTGAGKELVDITPNEWSAIQAGAVSNNRLNDILDNADLDQVRQLSMPRTPAGMTTVKASRAKTMASSGYSQADIAAALGVSVSTVKTALE